MDNVEFLMHVDYDEPIAKVVSEMLDTHEASRCARFDGKPFTRAERIQFLTCTPADFEAAASRCVAQGETIASPVSDQVPAAEVSSPVARSIEKH
jgi:hypothetical protein